MGFRSRKSRKGVLMATSSLSDSSAAKAAQILRDIFDSMGHGFTVRLWDGSEVRLGREVHPVTVVVPSVKSFKRILLNPVAFEFAEAYVDGDVDFLGDLFEVMKVADSMEEVDLSFWRKVRIAMKVKGLPE